LLHFNSDTTFYEIFFDFIIAEGTLVILLYFCLMLWLVSI